MPKVDVTSDDVTVHARPGETILAALSRSGYGYRTGCTRGGCGVCKVDLLAGSVTYNAVICSDVLTDDERSSGTCLSCRAVPDTDVAIALRNERLRRTNPFVAAARPHTANPINRKSPTRFGALGSSE